MWKITICKSTHFRRKSAFPHFLTGGKSVRIVDNRYLQKTAYFLHKPAVFLQHFVKKKSFPIHIYSQKLTAQDFLPHCSQLLQFYSRRAAGIKYRVSPWWAPIAATPAGTGFYRHLKTAENL